MGRLAAKGNGGTGKRLAELWGGEKITDRLALPEL
jgi:hypothetical protein